MSTTIIRTTQNFSFADSLRLFNVSSDAYLSANPTITTLVVSVVVMHNSRVLLIQRAATDGFPLQWECPGGGVDDGDVTLLHAAGRELREESGLIMSHAEAVLDDSTEWEHGNGRCRKITFLARIDSVSQAPLMPAVTLEPTEHQDFVWATKEEVERGLCDGRKLDFAYVGQSDTILHAFGSI
ncbi:NUDIX hydrolase domain-like protein [Bombardia bombarda]|uniref:NUDIX hydrolase domain-like protein n=1 Tax=Bombardia bombarda TaxID=252184 RepID=A0AA39X9I8_9PEZI|nr:NUDIX hydrolase domain-like protein [Bombardia bombarda]